MRKAILFGIVSALALTGVATAQTPVQKLIQAGKMTFRLNDSPYYIRIGLQCTLPAFQGGLGNQAPICATFSDLNNDGVALDFQVTIQQIVNTIQSTEQVTFIGTPIGNNRVRWQGSRSFDPPHCTFIAGGVQSWFQVTQVYGDFTMEITDLSNFQCIDGGPDLMLVPVYNYDPQDDESENYMGFNGLLMQAGDCNTGGPVPTCARTYTIRATAYSSKARVQGDVNGDGCVDDADLLIVLFNFGTGCGN